MQYKLFKNYEPRTNAGTVFREIYESTALSRQEIVYNTSLSLPTVRQSLNELLEKGLIDTSNYYASTGGRKASAISIVPMSRVAIGVEILKEHVQISAADLFGNIVREERCALLYRNDEEYCRQFAELIKSFISQIDVCEENLLEILISVQGIVSQDGETLITGKLLQNSGLSVNSFRKYLNLNCKFINDTIASAFSELWAHPETRDAAYIDLNRNLSGTIIVNSRVFQGDSFKGVQNCGMISHMRLIPGGIPCYCGHRGCIQGYCSIYSLESASGMSIEAFMELVHAKDEKSVALFDKYLSYLALGINNIRMIIDGEFIIGGYLDELMTDEDMLLLAEKVTAESPFENMTFEYRRSSHGSNAPARGAALLQINGFLDSI